MFEPTNPDHLDRYRRTIDVILNDKELEWIRLGLDKTSIEIILSDDSCGNETVINGIRNFLCSDNVMVYLLWEMTFGFTNGIMGHLICDQVLSGMMIELKKDDIPVRRFSVFLDSPEWSDGCVGYLLGDTYDKYDDNIEDAFRI